MEWTVELDDGGGADRVVKLPGPIIEGQTIRAYGLSWRVDRLPSICRDKTLNGGEPAPSYDPASRFPACAEKTCKEQEIRADSYPILYTIPRLSAWIQGKQRTVGTMPAELGG